MPIQLTQGPTFADGTCYKCFSGQTRKSANHTQFSWRVFKGDDDVPRIFQDLRVGDVYCSATTDKTFYIRDASADSSLSWVLVDRSITLVHPVYPSYSFVHCDQPKWILSASWSQSQTNSRQQKKRKIEQTVDDLSEASSGAGVSANSILHDALTILSTSLLMTHPRTPSHTYQLSAGPNFISMQIWCLSQLSTRDGKFQYRRGTQNWAQNLLR